MLHTEILSQKTKTNLFKQNGNLPLKRCSPLQVRDPSQAPQPQDSLSQIILLWFWLGLCVPVPQLPSSMPFHGFTLPLSFTMSFFCRWRPRGFARPELMKILHNSLDDSFKCLIVLLLCREFRYVSCSVLWSVYH